MFIGSVRKKPLILIFGHFTSIVLYKNKGRQRNSGWTKTTGFFARPRPVAIHHIYGDSDLHVFPASFCNDLPHRRKLEKEGLKIFSFVVDQSLIKLSF